MIYRLDETNNLICGYSENYPYFQEDWNIIETDLLPNDSFHINHWNGSEFIESATQEEITQIKTPIYMQRLQNVVTDLRIKAKGAAIGKTGTTSYIVAQVEFYEIKYQQCTNPNNSQEVEDLLANEAAEYGISLAQFKALVISMYEQAKEKYNLFMRMIERCRTKIQTLIENNNWQSADTAFEIVAMLDNVEEAQSVMNEILAL